jgi:hypothetical protein
MSLREKLPQYLASVPDHQFDWTLMPLGGIPTLGIPGFHPGFAPTYKLILDIPGVPRLISRGKDNFFTNWMVDHFGLVFATGPDGSPRPEDVAFELSFKSNFELAPMVYWDFPKKWGPVYIWDIKIDSKDKVIERLEKFFKNPKKYRFWLYNCEDFAREILTGIPACLQRDKVVETSKMVVDVAAQVLVKWMEMEQQRRAAEEEAKRKAGVAQAVAPVTPPAQAVQPLAQPAPVAVTPAPIPPFKPVVRRLPPPNFKPMPPIRPKVAVKKPKVAPKPRNKRG